MRGDLIKLEVSDPASGRFGPSAETIDRLANEQRILVGGEWRSAAGDEWLPVENPATGEVFAEVRSASRADLDSAVAAARNALSGEWRRMSPRDRAQLLFRFADLLEERAERICELETLENGMPWPISVATLKTFCVDYLRYCAGWVTKLDGKNLPVTLRGREDVAAHAYTSLEPIGVVGAIIPWNVPGPMMILKLAPSLAAGCTIVIKPAELTPLTAVAIAELWEEAGGPPGVVNLLQGTGHDIGAAMAAHPGIDKITFTGSTEVGKRIVRAAADDLKRVSLELGGKSPFIVFPDANLSEAIPASVRACFYLAGQNCMAGTRLFVHECIADEFVAGVAELADRMRLGGGFDPATELGPLISGRQKARVLDYIAAGKAEGARLVCGGADQDGPGHFLRPTIFDHCHPGMRIVREEIFGPVLTVQRFGDDLEALVEAFDATDYGLSGSIWTADIARAMRLAERVDSGQVGINMHAAMSPETPFGGNRQSGWGREFGRDGIDQYLKTKAVSINLGPR